MTDTTYEAASLSQSQKHWWQKLDFIRFEKTLSQAEYWSVYLQADCVSWSRCAGANHQILDSGSCKRLDEVPVPRGARINICVPGVHVRIHMVEIPARSKRQFLSALPYSLEDVLLLDVDNYHLVALGKFSSHSRMPVAVVEHRLMRDWLEQLCSLGCTPVSLVPDYLDLPRPDAKTWVIDATAEPLLLRRPDDSAGAVISAGLEPGIPAALLLALEDAETGPEKLEVICLDEKQQAQFNDWKQVLQDRGVTLQLVECEQSRDLRFCTSAQINTHYNLLAGDYKVAGEQALSFSSILRPLAILTLILLVLVAQWFLNYSQLKDNYEVLQEQMRNTFLQAFPETRNIVDPRFQMQQKTERLRAESQTMKRQKDILAWLEVLAPEINIDTAVSLVSLDYDKGELRLELTTTDYQVLENLQARLARHGVVRLDNVDRLEQAVRASVSIRQKQ